MGMSGEDTKKSGSGTMYIAYVVTLYWMVSISMVYLNKLLLSNQDASIPAPLFVTWYQCIVTVGVVVLLGQVGESFRAIGRESFFNQFPLIRFDMKRCLKVLPLSLIFVGMISFNNIW
jgi:GDP-fucose transporter C1